jgi:peroxiredoxin
MKFLAIPLALLLLAAALGCAAKQTPEEVVQDKAPAADAAAPEGAFVPDFTVQTIDGGTFTLSETLQDHDLVLINLFGTFCPPCAEEFPFLQKAWEQTSDRVSVIALSVDPAETDEVLIDYANGLGITFPIGHEPGTELIRYAGGYPTSILVGKDLRIAALDVGARTSTEEFIDWLDSYSGTNRDSGTCVYKVYCYGAENYEDVTGVVVNFCTDTACYPVTTAEMGCAVFTGAPAKYHVQIVKIPDGWQLESEAEWYTEPYGQTFWIPLSPVQP